MTAYEFRIRRHVAGSEITKKYRRTCILKRRKCVARRSNVNNSRDDVANGSAGISSPRTQVFDATVYNDHVERMVYIF